MSTNLQVTLIKSTIGRPKKHRDIVAGLGLKRLNHSVEHADTPEVRGMISKISHMLNVAQ
jgi:large subunit ribosomal protein L30